MTLVYPGAACLEKTTQVYNFSDVQNDEFVVPPLGRWPGWTRPNLISMYMTRFGIRPEPKARPMKVETSVASGVAGTPVVPEFLKHQQAQQGQPSSGSSARLEPCDPTNDIWLQDVALNVEVKEGGQERATCSCCLQCCRSEEDRYSPIGI